MQPMTPSTPANVKHSPLPWENVHGGVYVNGSWTFDMDINTANTALILKACNNYYQLIDALKSIADTAAIARQNVGRVKFSSKQVQMLLKAAEDRARKVITEAEKQPILPG